MKKRVSMLVILLVCLTITPAYAEKIVLRFVSFREASNYPKNQQVYRMKEIVEAYAPDRIEIKLLGGPEVIDSFEALDAVSKGMFDGLNSCPAYYVGAVPELGATAAIAPWKWPDAFRETGVLDILDKVCVEKMGVKMLGVVGDGPMYLATKGKKITRVEDIQGLKFRAPGPIGHRIATRLGAVAVSMPVSESYEALKKGVVDGTFTNAITTYDTNINEVVQYKTAPDIEFKVAVWINKKSWDKIPKDIQEKMEEAMIRAELEHYGYYQCIEREYIQKAKDDGIKVYDMPEKELRKIREARVADLKEHYVKQCPEYGPEIVRLLEPYLFP